MKYRKFYLLLLKNGGNKVVMACLAENESMAIDKFNAWHLSNHKLDANGYKKTQDGSTYCIATMFGE